MLSQEDTKIFLNTYLVIQIFIPFCGVVLHLLFLYAVWKDPLKCLRKLGTAFVINLAVSDLLFCFTLLIRVSIHLVADIGKEARSLQSSSTGILFSNVSCLTVVSISVDRFILVVYPFKHRYWIKKKVIAVWISLIWFVNVLYCLKRLIFGVEKNYEIILYAGLLFALFSLSSVVYTLVYIALKKKLKNRTKLNEGNELRDRAKDVSLLKEKKFLKTIILIVSTTFVSFVPSWILLFKYPENALVPGSLLFWIFVTIYCLLLLTNFAINPLIYILRFPNYQKTFRILYCRK